MDFETPRVLIDKTHPDIQKAQRQVAIAVRRAARDAGLDRKLVELVNIRVSQINGCAFCLDVHLKQALEAGDSMQRIVVLPAWRETELFSDEECAALILAELVTRLPGAYEADREYWSAADVLSAEQVSAIIWIAITINAFNRISILSAHRVRAEADAGAV